MNKVEKESLEILKKIINKYGLDKLQDINEDNIDEILEEVAPELTWENIIKEVKGNKQNGRK